MFFFLSENTATPYLAIVGIGSIQYGKGFGSSKKQAKHDAAKNTLEILIPEMKDKIDEDKRLWGRAGSSKSQTDLSVSSFAIFFFFLNLK